MIVNENKLENTPTGGALVGKRKGQTMIHNKGSMSGYLVGKTHAEGGIKAINKSTGQPLEMQGGEVVITAPAVSDQTKRNFDGKMMTNRQILSAINERGGGVSFAESGMEIPTEMHFNGTSYNYGGKMLSDHDIAYELSQCGCEHEMKGGGHLAEGFSLRDIAEIHQVPLSELKKQVRLGMKAESEHTASKREQMKIVKDHLFENPNYYTLLKKAGLEDGAELENFKYSKQFSGITIYTNIEQEYVGNNYSPFESKGSFKATVRRNDLENIALESKDLVNFNFKYGVDDWNTIAKKLKDKKITKLELYQVGKTIKTFELKPIKEAYKKGGEVQNLSKDAKSGNTPARDLNNYNDVLDVGADGEVGGDTGIYANGGGIDKANYRIIKSNGRVKYAGTGMPSWFTLDKAKQNVDYSQGEMIYEYDNNGERLYEVFVDGGEVGSDFTFLKSNPMQRARAITVLEKKIRHDGKIMSNYEFLEQLPKDLEVGVSKLHSRKTERGYIEKLSIGNFIVDAKAEIDYYQYLQNGGYPYSKYLKEVREAEAKKNEADKIIRDEQQKANELKNIENHKNSEIAKKNQIKELIEIGADAMIKKMNAPRLMQIEKYKSQRQTNDVKQEIDYHVRMVEQTERQVNNAYKIASELYEIVNGEVQPKFNWKIGDKVKVGGYINNLPAEIETEIVEAKEGRYGEIIYQVEKKEGIANNYITYDGLYPLTQNNIKNLDWDTTFTNGFSKGEKLSEQEIETIDVYNDFIYGLTFKNGGLFDATTEQTIGLLSITDNQVNLAVILEKNVDGADYKAITYNQKIKRRLHNLAEKSGRIIVINAFKLRSELRQFPYLLVSENDAKIYEVASEFYEKLETPRNEFRKQFTKKLEDEKQNKKEYEYVLTIRPFDIGTYPKDNFIRFEQQKYQYGVVIYSEPLPIREIEHFSLCPITEIKEFNNKFLYYTFSDTKQKIQVKLIPDERKGYFVEIIYYDGDKVEDNVMMSAVQFLKNVQEGNYKLENEIKDEPKKDDVEITTGYFKVDSENTGFEYAKKINNYFNKWNKIKTLQDKLDFETLDVPMFGSFENETVLDQIERFEKLGFELFANEIVRNDFKKEVRKIIDKKTSDREMEKRRYPKKDEEVAKKQKSFESEGSTEGKGKLYEFFTPQVVADKMLALAQHYGFKGGNVLEPATGSGRLIKNLKDTNITAFEISKDNFEILKREFPNAELYNFNFEKAFLKEPRFNTLLNRKGTETWLKGAPFDLVLANPPYGKFSGLYSSYFNFKGQVEHFFILQTLYLLKKGGLGVYLIPSSFLRNGSAYNEIKKQIFEIAEFVDAYRLPSNIFEKTQIGTDILILRKK